MEIKSRKTRILIGSLIVTAIGIVVFFGVQQLAKTWKARFGTLHSKKTFVVTLDLRQQEKFFEQFTRFADVNDFKIRIGQTTPAGDTFNIIMSRKDVMVIANNVFDTKKYNVHFYDRDPTNPVPEELIDDLFNDLQRYISEVPDTIITEQRKSLTITIDESQREELLTQMQKLAKEHSLEFQISFSSDKTLFDLEIYGDGFHITSAPVVGSPREISIVFFIDYHKAPTPTSLETVDNLSDELKSMLSEFPNVTIFEGSS